MKRVLSMVLLLAMMLTMVPVSARAETTNSPVVAHFFVVLISLSLSRQVCLFILQKDPSTV